MTAPYVSVEKLGALGLLTLRRPAALNALNLGMVRAMLAALDSWVADEKVSVVAIRGEGARGFCAGGDIRAWVMDGPETALDFLRTEYRLNHCIATYPKPTIALMHGVTMGGGAGLSVHARHRLADASLIFAMPEVNIGFVPDIGSTYFLPRCPDQIGMYLALTAARIGQGDAIAAGLADRAVPMTDFEPLLENLARGATVHHAIDAVAGRPGPVPLMVERARLAAFFGAPSVEGVLERLARDSGEFARGAARAIRANAPTSLKLAFHLLRRSGDLTLQQCLQQEYHAASLLLKRPDLREGVRAALVDKDRNPKWQPAALAAVTDADVAALTAEVPTAPTFE